MKVIAFYLPQYHPVPENDLWWGAGFTEWRNVAKSRPLFRGHVQPHLPGELSFYDLRLGETHDAQAELASQGGISAFCYYHYWFSGKLLLQKPVELLLIRRKPDFPFCLCWANHDWTAHWVGQSSRLLIKQEYPGEEDDRRHYEYLRNFFVDSRYFRIADRPVLMLFHPDNIPHLADMLKRLNGWARQDGLGQLWTIGLTGNRDLLQQGLDAIAPHSLNDALGRYLRGRNRLWQVFRHRFLRYPRWVVDYNKLEPYFSNCECDGLTLLPTAVPNWDNTPRLGRRGFVLHGSNPGSFYHHLRRSISGFDRRQNCHEHVLLVKSWNEWAEGNYLEPDLVWQRGWLSALQQFVTETINDKQASS